MKHLSLIVLWISLGFSTPLQAQLNAPNNIFTNPTAASNPQRPHRVNTFNWMRERFFTAMRNCRDMPLGQPDSILSPFFQTDNIFLSHLTDPAWGGSKDFMADDGWEIIKESFGLNIPGSSINNPYMILYNKYRGILRVFVARGNENEFNGAYMILKFAEKSPMQTALLDYQAEIKALKDNFVANTGLLAFTKLANRCKSWFYADFPVLYDPCTCLYESKLSVVIRFTNTAQVPFEGPGQSPLISNGRYTDANRGAGSFSFSANLGTEPQKAHVSYYSVNALRDDLRQRGTPLNNVNQFIETLKSPHFMQKGLSYGEEIALSSFSTFTSGGRNAGASSLITSYPTGISKNNRYIGISNGDFPMMDITFRTPGSQTEANGGVPNSEYPTYNEMLGILNLIEVPVINYSYEKRPFGGATPFGEPTRYRETFSYKLAQPIQYALNPAARVEIQDIKAALILGAGAGTWNSPNVGHVEGRDITNPEAKYRSEYIDLSCFSERVFRVYTVDPISPAQAAPSGTAQIKLFVNLKRQDAGPNTQNILYVLTYPVRLREVSQVQEGTQACAGIVQAPMAAQEVENFCNGAYRNSARFASVAGRSYEQRVNDLALSEKQEAKVALLNSVEKMEFYPNPAVGSGKLRYTNPQAGKVKIFLMDATGRSSQVLYEAYQEAGSYQIELDLSAYSEGLYLLVQEVNGIRNVERILIKK